MAKLNFKKWLAAKNSKPTKPTKMKKNPWRQSMSKQVRDIEDDLSSDYKGHLVRNGSVDPFKVLKGR